MAATADRPGLLAGGDRRWHLRLRRRRLHGLDRRPPLASRSWAWPPTPSGGYWLVAADGAVYAFGDAAKLGSATAVKSAGLAVASTPSGGGLLGGGRGRVAGHLRRRRGLRPPHRRPHQADRRPGRPCPADGQRNGRHHPGRRAPHRPRRPYDADHPDGGSATAGAGVLPALHVSPPAGGDGRHATPSQAGPGPPTPDALLQGAVHPGQRRAGPGGPHAGSGRRPPLRRWWLPRPRGRGRGDHHTGDRLPGRARRPYRAAGRRPDLRRQRRARRHRRVDGPGTRREAPLRRRPLPSHRRWRIALHRRPRHAHRAARPDLQPAGPRRRPPPRRHLRRPGLHRRGVPQSREHRVPPASPP